MVNEYWVTVAAWNQQRQWIHYRRMKLIEKIESWAPHGIVKKAISRLLHKSPAKQSNSRPWNRQWILSDSYRMESIASINSRPPHQIDRKNRVMADAWNCKKRYVTAYPKIAGLIRVTVDLEIVNEYWVTATAWNRQRQWIYDRRIKSIEKIESWPTHGIVKNAISRLIHKSPAKTE
jgi:hypothetical protein